MKKNKLHRAVLAALGVSAMAAYSSQASAFGSIDIGTFTGSTISVDSTTPFKAFSDYKAKNQGWMHTARFFTLTIGDASEMASGKTYDVQLKMTGRGTLNLGDATAAAINNPSFAVWTAGTGAINTGQATSIGHGWNPTRGVQEIATDVNGDSTTVWTNETLGVAGILDGHQGWIGYVNSGPAYTLINQLDPLNGSYQTDTGAAVLDSVSNGGLNTSSLSWLTNPGASSTSFSNNYYRNGDNGPTVGSVPDFAMMILSGLKAGNYLIGLGGSCPGYPSDSAAAAACGKGSQFTFEVSAAPAAVPVPGAVWLFGSAMIGLLGIGRRKQNQQA